MTSTEIRNSFLKFFEERGHRIVPSAPVFPFDDPTLLFTNAGMNQFKDVFLGTGKREYTRAADTQKCIRVSGKHNDLEEVGCDTYHHTFFEMLGNWSFGDYYKREAIEWAWELLTKVWGLDKKRLYATVFESDDEAADLWIKMTDIDPSHVLRFGKKDNFWEMGETGPCGPCSEIHIDLTPDMSGGKLVNAGDPRVMEIWNLVFIQYDRDQAGNLTPLPAKHVDTGMGFERICAVLQGKRSNYDTDVFMPIILRIADIVGKSYGGKIDSPTDIAMRVIADHVRMLTVSIADGGVPSNEGRGYVMRRILRRAARFGRNLGLHEAFIYRVVDSVVATIGDVFPEIIAKQSHIERVIKGEEEGFSTTLDRGIELHQDEVRRSVGAGSRVFSGEVAFKLHDTSGFPIDLTQLMARENGLDVDMEKFEERMAEQRSRSRADRYEPDTAAWIPPDAKSLVVFNSEMARQLDAGVSEDEVKFVGYEQLEAHGAVLYCKANALVLDTTPFYAEAGGQVGDLGVIEFDGRQLKVVDTQRGKNGNVHLLEAVVDIPPHVEVILRVNAQRRHEIMRNHSATHLVHEALRQVLGDHLHQQGSLVAADYLRFDFNHFERVSQDELRAIEDIVNEKISDAIPVAVSNDPKDWLAIEEAKRRYPNIKMFFGDKYGDRVRIVEIDPKFSVELCGGTHVGNTRDIGPFKIVSEASVASGIRRIVAVTGDGLRRYVDEKLHRIGDLDEQLAALIEEKATLEKQLGIVPQVEEPKRERLIVPARSENLNRAVVDDIEAVERARESTIEEIAKAANDLKKELSKRRVHDASGSMEQLVSSAFPFDGFKIVSSRVEAHSIDELKSMGDALRAKLGSGVGVLGAIVDEKAAFVCVVTDDLMKSKNLHAGKIVGKLAKRVGGGGGGRPHLATAGGKEVAKLDDALNQTKQIIESLLLR